MKRIGKFYRDVDFSDEDTIFVLTRMKFIPLRVEFLAHRNRFEHIGISHMFDEIENGSEAPEYLIAFSKKDNIVDLNRM